jgi:hypothetical protein
MDIPTPKTPTFRNTTRDERLRAQTLYFEANFTIDQIALQINLTRDQVRYAIAHRITPQKSKSGRKLFLNTPQRKRLIQWTTASKDNRHTQWKDIPELLGFDCGIKAIRAAFKKEGYIRAIARRKPPLSEPNRLDRLAWAWEHIFWTDEQWDRVLWSDESWVQPGRHRKLRVTRKEGPEEVYHPDCVSDRHQRKIGWMFWGSISGKYGRHKGLFWEKDWETVNEGSYSGIIVPLVQEIIQEYPDLIFQQDNAKGHASAFTMSVFEAIGFKPMHWPANSPDLNPIETLWDIMKDYIDNHYPGVHRSYPRLRAAVQEAWDSITHTQIQELIRGMGDRCIEVILADGLYTKY